MHKRTPTKPITPMERRVPKNEKYNHIGSRLNTGLTVNKVQKVTARTYAKRRDELFYRITPLQLAELYREYEADDVERIQDYATNGFACYMNGQANDRSEVRVVTHDREDTPSYTRPYLILDMRESPEYSRGHLLQARSYPHALLRRAQFHPEILQYRNVPESLIIVYCDDEKVSAAAAKDLVDRGVENVFLLTGGMNACVQDLPAQFIEGKANPGAYTAVPSSAQSMRNAARSARGLSAGANTSTLGRISEDREFLDSTNPNRLTMARLESHNMRTSGNMSTSSRMSSRHSETSNLSVAESVISRSVARKGRF